MTEIIDLNSKRPPVVYTVTIAHHYDDTLEFRIEDVADDERSREAVMSAFRRVSGADEEIEKLRTDLRHAINCDSEYAKEVDRQNSALREENTRLREALEQSANELIERCDMISRNEAVKIIKRAAAAAIREGGKDA